VGVVRRDAEERGSTQGDHLIQQAFDLNGFLDGDIDAAQAMTYNEYAQVLETRTRQLGSSTSPRTST
jgi:NitT/TauT family transport system substrate-binding protein